MTTTRILLLLIAILTVACASATKPSKVTFVPTVGTSQDVARPGYHLMWDYPTPDLAAHNLSHFNVQYDSDPLRNVGLPQDSQTSTLTSYKDPLPPMVAGPHIVKVQACNPYECGDWSSTLKFVFSIRPGAPQGPRIIVVPPPPPLY